MQDRTVTLFSKNNQNMIFNEIPALGRDDAHLPHLAADSDNLAYKDIIKLCALRIVRSKGQTTEPVDPEQI